MTQFWLPLVSLLSSYDQPSENNTAPKIGALFVKMPHSIDTKAYSLLIMSLQLGQREECTFPIIIKNIF